MKTIGVLALQGAFHEHIDIITKLGHKAIDVRTSEDLKHIDGLILPGGESTVMGKLLNDYNMKIPLVECIRNGLPVWGTCAGMILLANQLENDTTTHLQVMNITVKRNAYGRQLDSFISHELIQTISETLIPLVFIRAPYILSIGEGVEVLHESQGHIVAARQGNMLATSFHPELTNNKAFHSYFLEMLEASSYKN